VCSSGVVFDKKSKVPTYQHHKSVCLRLCVCVCVAAACCERLSPREASDAELLAVHSPGLVAAVAALSNANAPADLNRVAAHLAPDALGNR